MISKLVAFREKDLEFTGAVLRAGLVDSNTLLERAQTLEVPAKRKMVISWLVAWIQKSG